MGTTLPTLQPLAQAIAQAEGYGVGNNIPTLANNPGSLQLGDLGYGTIQAQGDQQITIFPSAGDGWTALQNQLNKIFSGQSKYYTPEMPLSQFGSIYSGGNSQYGNTLATILGTTPDTNIATANGVDQSTNAPGGPTIWDGIKGSLNEAFGPSIFGVTVGPTSTDPTAKFSVQRAVILLLGVILFAAGLFSFKQTQVLIQGVTKAGKTAAELTA